MIEVGNLVVCVDAAPNPEWVEWTGDANYTRDLIEGRAYRVARVIHDDGPFLDVGVPSPLCSPYPKVAGSWPAYRFRKILPDEHAPCEQEFLTLLNRSKRRVGHDLAAN